MAIFRQKWAWATLAIASMWLAVLFTGVFAPSLVSESVGSSRTEIPLGGIVALFALVGTIAVAIFGFRGDGEQTSTHLGELDAEVAELRAHIAGLEQRVGRETAAAEREPLAVG
jgi:hypothetical protein